MREFLLGDEKFDVKKYYSFIDKVYKKRVGRSAGKLLDELKINNYPLILMQGVQDDKTMVGLINTNSVVDNREETFYQEPDWQKLQDAWNRKAYPHLYPAKKTSCDKKNAENIGNQTEIAIITKDSEKQKHSNRFLGKKIHSFFLK